MYNYCTLFDSFYLSRGIAMYESLVANSKNFHLYIFAFDELSLRILKDLNLENATIISLSEFETPALLKTKPSRTKGEYCWTCTPATLMHVLKKYNVDSCTYIDSDLIFYSDPSILIDELAGKRKSVLITEHRYSGYARLYSNKRSGRFCVQFNTFMNSDESIKVLEKWMNQCIDWCYARYEDGKFGDQKYLDEWPLQYNNVHILENEGGGMAPWNILKYRFIDRKGIHAARKAEKNYFPVIFYHFQYVKFLPDGSADIGWYFIPRNVLRLFYIPYLIRVRNIENRLKKNYPDFEPGITDFKINNLKSLILKKLAGYNIIKL